MLRKLLFVPLFLLTFIAIPTAIKATEPVNVSFFYGEGCPHCARMDSFLTELKEERPEMNIIKHEVYFDSEGRNLYLSLFKSLGREPGGVPTIVIGNQVLLGFDESVAEQIKNLIARCSVNGCASPLDSPSTSGTDDDLTEIPTSDVQPPVTAAETTSTNKNYLLKNLTIPAVLSAAAVDAINPCAFAVLVILLTTILATGSRRRGLLAGLAFSLSVFISYLLMGLGLYSAISGAGVSKIFYGIMAGLAVLLGLFNLKDSLWYGKWFVMEVPMSWRPRLKALIRSVTSIPGAFLVGFAVSLFLLPCTSGPYVVILGLLNESTARETALAYLVLYNLIFVLPMVGITLAIYGGLTTTEKVEAWRTSRLKTLHLIAGSILILLGVTMLVTM